MRIELRLQGHRYVAQTEETLDLAIPQTFAADQPNAFGLPHATAAPVAGEGWVLDTRQGGSVNCARLNLIPHANGTHTECVAHIVNERLSLHALLHPSLLVARLVRVEADTLGGSGESYGGLSEASDSVLSARRIRAALAEQGVSMGTATPGAEDGATASAPLSGGGLAREHPSRDAARAACPPFDPGVQATVIATQAGGDALRTRAWSGSGAPYFTDEAVALLKDCGYQHLLVDLPSVDREEDGGALAAHRGWWDLPPDVRSAGASPSRRTITEMIAVASWVPGGLYLLELQIPAMAVDAAPSRPRLTPLRALPDGPAPAGADEER